MTVPLERQKNIADVAARVREQLGLGSAAVSEQSDFATAAQGDKADSALPANELPIYATVIGMPSLEIPVGINAIRVNGYYAAGDGGGALYRKTDAEPTHGGKLRTANGIWFEIDRKQVNPRMFGAIGDLAERRRL